MANKLELTWYGKAEPIIVEPRILIENATMSNNFAESDTENMLIHGDNLLALKALESKFSGKIKCIYIDPPYNTGSAFEQYDDNLEHSQWLNLMRPRLEILRKLLSDNGTIWISIDDDEGHYLKVLCDEVFGRNNFISTVVWEKKFSPQNDAKWLSDSHDFILVYSKRKEIWKPNLLPRTASMDKRYKNPDNDPRGPWASSDFTARTYSASTDYPITTPSGRVVTPTKSRSWISSKEELKRLIADNRIWFGKNGNNVPRKKTFLSEVQDGIVPLTCWRFEEVGSTQDAKKEVKAINPEDPFATPKPERLIEKILRIATNQNELVLDSFLGSGTTAAVAHKMGRRWIGIEMGEHAYTHCKVRLDKVVAGKDKGGITKSVSWKGGGGYRFFELASTLINTDSFGEPVINTEYSADMLAAAVALHEGFEYQPDSDLFWKQSIGNEKSFLFVTTRHMNSNYLDSIKDTMEEDEYLIIACRSFDAGLDSAFKHISLKKIPQMLLDRCEFGRTDYNLNIIHPPVYEDDMEVECNE
ncbi:MAG: site-specific DNA-methyltransferase [Sphaerochaeta sp.]|jgi:adenine-specific DNA-methyltransferase